MANPQLTNGYIKIANDLWDALIAIRIPGEARQVFDLILRKTYGFNKTEDFIPLSQFVDSTNIKKANIIRALKKLSDMNLIVIQKDNSIIQKDNNPYIRYRVVKDYERWRPLSKKITVLSKKIIGGYSKKSTSKDNKNYKAKDNREVVAFFDYYLSRVKRKYTLTTDKKQLIASRLKDGFTLTQLKQAVDSFVADPWDGRKNRMDLIYCIGRQQGKPDNLEKWLNHAKPKSTWAKEITDI